MEKKKIGVLFIDKTPKTTRDGDVYLTGIPEGNETHSLIAYENTSKNGVKYLAIYMVEKDPRYSKPQEKESDSSFSKDHPDEKNPFDDMPF